MPPVLVGFYFIHKLTISIPLFYHHCNHFSSKYGTVEAGEEYKETALREVLEETGVRANIIKYVGKSQYSFSTASDDFTPVPVPSVTHSFIISVKISASCVVISVL